MDMDFMDLIATPSNMTQYYQINCLILLSQIEFPLNFHSCNLNGMEF